MQSLFEVLDKQVPLPPPRGTILAVRMPCGQEALARVRYATFPDSWCGWGLKDACGLRIEWLPATERYVRGYQMNWGRKLESLIEGNLHWPPDPTHTAYGSIQLGDYRVVSAPYGTDLI